MKKHISSLLNKNIRFKFMFFVIVLIISSLSTQIIFNLFLSESALMHEKERQVVDLYYKIKNNYSDSPSILFNTVSDAQDEQNMNVIIFSENGTVIYSTYPNTKHQLKNIDNYTSSPSIITSTFFNENGERIQLFGKIQLDDNIRFITIVTSIKAINDSVMVFTKYNVLISSIILALGTIGAYFFAQHISKPIKKIESVAKHVSHLNFDIKAEEHLTTIELNSLSNSINMMSEKMKTMIAELSKSNEALKDRVDYQNKVDQMRKSFIANVSHEMKTPLSMLLMYCESLKNNVAGIDREYYYNTIMEEAERLNHMVKEMLDISSIEHGLIIIQPEECNLSQLLLILINKNHLLLKDFTISSNIEKNLYVLGDKKYLERAMSNYIINATSHTKIGQTIRISLIQKDGIVFFKVFNQGSYISSEDIPLIWDSFYRADKARTQRESSRVGLGLYIVKTIIQAHQGTFGVRNLNDGVEFWFTLTNHILPENDIE